MESILAYRYDVLGAPLTIYKFFFFTATAVQGISLGALLLIVRYIIAPRSREAFRTVLKESRRQMTIVITIVLIGVNIFVMFLPHENANYCNYGYGEYSKTTYEKCIQDHLLRLFSGEFGNSANAVCAQDKSTFPFRKSKQPDLECLTEQTISNELVQFCQGEQGRLSCSVWQDMVITNQLKQSKNSSSVLLTLKACDTLRDKTVPPVRNIVNSARYAECLANILTITGIKDEQLCNEISYSYPNLPTLPPEILPEVCTK